MRTRRTSVELPEDLYNAFKAVGGNLAHLTRDAMRDYIGIKGASEDSLAILEMKLDRLNEDKMGCEKRLSELDNLISAIETQIGGVKGKMKEVEDAGDQAMIMRDEVNPYVRGLDYKVVSMTPELHEMVIKLRAIGLVHNLESLQRHAVKLQQADYYTDIRS